MCLLFLNYLHVLIFLNFLLFIWPHRVLAAALTIFWHVDSLVVECGLNWPMARGTLVPDQRSNPHPLHCKADHQESPLHVIILKIVCTFKQYTK